MAWIQPICDRSELDIRNRTSKGFCNIEDINRLESNLKYLSGKLGVSYSEKEWFYGDLIRMLDFRRWEAAVSAVRERGIVLPDTPEIPAVPWVDIYQWNDVEKILSDLKTMMDNAEKGLAYAGEFYSGERGVL